MYTARIAAQRLSYRESSIVWLAALALVAACLVPALTAGRGRLTSDESLYVAEALNISQGRGAVYTTGEPVVHRAPLFPALLALDFKLAGGSLDAATWVSRLATVLNAFMVALLARRLAGSVAALVCGVVVASAAYLNGLGASIFLDQVECAFVLASLLLLSLTPERKGIVPHFSAGLILGLAALTKESALQMAPLPLLLALIGGAYPGWRRGLAAWSAGLGLVAGVWWLWVFVQSGQVYLLGDPATPAVGAIAAGFGLGVVAAATALSRWGGAVTPRPMAIHQALGIAFLAVWVAAFIAGLEWQAWEHPRRYLTDVPHYFLHVLTPGFPAAPLILAALIWAMGRALRGHREAAFVSCACLLFSPFVIVIANRELALRDAAPFLYAGSLALGCAAAWLVDWGSDLGRGQRLPIVGLAGAAVVAVALAAVALPGAGRVERAAALTPDGDWDNAIAAGTADWLSANVAPGTPVMSTRLYFSQVYFLTGGAFPIHQLPTVLVEPGSGRALKVRTTLFRWEVLPGRERDSWLYLTRYGAKGYYIGLAQADLIADIRERGIEYLILNVADAGFSSPAFAAYFDANPAFTRVYEQTFSPTDQTVIYRVDRGLLAPSAAPLRVTSVAYRGLLGRLSGDAAAVETFLRSLNPAGFEVVP